MYLIETSIFILLAWVIWNFVWKAAVLDWARDHLFDLRDEARMWFMQDDRSLDDAAYKALRVYLNIYIKHIERATLTGFFFSLSEKNLEAGKKIGHELNTLLHSENPEINNFIWHTRQRAAFIVSVFMISRSFAGMMLLAIIFIKCVIQAFLSLLSNLGRYKVVKSPSLFSWTRKSIDAAIERSGFFSSKRVEAYTREKA